MLLATNCPRSQMTPGEDDSFCSISGYVRIVTSAGGLPSAIFNNIPDIYICKLSRVLHMFISAGDASHRGTQIGGDVHDTVAISDGHIGSTDVDIFRRSAVCLEVDIPANMDCAVMELSDVTILRRRSQQAQDLAEHQEGCIGISNTAVEFKDGAFRRLRLPRTKLFAEGMEEKCVVPRTDTVSSEQEDRTFFRPKPPRRVAFTEQDMNCNDIRGNSAMSEPCDHLCRRRNLPRNMSRMDSGGLIHTECFSAERTFRRTKFGGMAVTQYIAMESFSTNQIRRR